MFNVNISVQHNGMLAPPSAANLYAQYTEMLGPLSATNLSVQLTDMVAPLSAVNIGAITIFKALLRYTYICLYVF